MTDREFALLILSILPGLDGAGLTQLGQLLLDSDAVRAAVIEGRLRDIPGINPRAEGAVDLASGVVQKRARVLAARCHKAGISLVFRGSEAYPDMPTQMNGIPPVLYVRGDPQLLASPVGRVAMVGTRKATQLGIAFARRSAAQLADAGLIIVSGLAIGIDAASHRGALDVDGHTIAVLASGVDELTPRRNEQLGLRILERGAVVSERPPGSPVGPWSFPERNRIIAALSDDTVIIEAGVNSGSQHTADRAYDYNRNLYAMPGRPGDPVTAGCLALLTKGKARLFASAADLLEDRDLRAGPAFNLDPELLNLAQLLRAHLPCRLDELPQRLGLQDRIPVLLGSVNLLKLYNILDEDGSGYLNLVTELPEPATVPVDSG